MWAVPSLLRMACIALTQRRRPGGQGTKDSRFASTVQLAASDDSTRFRQFLLLCTARYGPGELTLQVMWCSLFSCFCPAGVVARGLVLLLSSELCMCVCMCEGPAYLSRDFVSTLLCCVVLRARHGDGGPKYRRVRRTPQTFRRHPFCLGSLCCW